LKENLTDLTKSGNNNKLIIYPEIVAEAIKNNEVDLYILWLVSKKVDIKGDGIISIKEVMNIAKIVLGYKSNHIYNKLNAGVDKFWSKIFKHQNERSICLFGLKRVLKRYNPSVLGSKPFVLPLAYLKSEQSLNTKFVKQLMICIVGCRYGFDKPISIMSIVENVGLSESTVRNALYSCPLVEIRNNFIKINTNLVIDSSYKLLSDGSVVKQIPNSYNIDLERLPLRNRPKELKKANINIDLYDKKKYYKSTVQNQNILSISSYNR
jgi:hypothetical protein